MLEGKGTLTPPGRPCLRPGEGLPVGMGEPSLSLMTCIVVSVVESACLLHSLSSSFRAAYRRYRFPPTFENRYWPANQDRHNLTI